MNRPKIKLILLLMTAIFLISSINILICLKGEPSALKPEFGQTPVIDGFINKENDEWEGSLKLKIKLFQNLSNPTNGLLIDLWIMQDDTNIFFSVQFEFEDHSSNEFNEEFIGILISQEDPVNPENVSIYLDAKIVQFSNISIEDFTYGDYWINDSIYYMDDDTNGDGAAALEGDKVTYEFSLPVDVYDDSQQDVFLRPLFTYSFSFIYGKSQTYPDGIILSNYKILEIQFSQYENPFTGWDILLLIFNIVIFGTIGGFYCLYLYRITKLKGKIRRLRG